MPLPATNAQADGVSSITRGMNCGVQPRLVPQGQLAFAINVTNRGGLPKTRPPYHKVALTYSDLDHEAAGTTQTRATEALFQGAAFYQAYGKESENCLVASIGGRLFRYLVASSNVVQDISVQHWNGAAYDTDLNSSNNPDCWIWQAEDFLIVNNGQAYPLFFDGAKTRRSGGEASQELPVGCMGAYVQGRNWWVLPGRQAFAAGDLVYSHGFNDGYNGRSAVLQTTENTFLSGGGAFGVPVTAGPITAMTSVAIADTSLGQGSLQVMTLGAVFSVQVPFDRTLWASTQYPLMTIGLPNYGAVAQTAAATVNGDIWYRSQDGLRSYRIGRRDLASFWVNSPQSVEVEKILMWDDKGLLGKATGILFNNRLLQSVSPFEVKGRGTAHRGLVALDFNNISTLTSRAEPVYDSLWTGLNILQLVKGTFHGVERCFAFALDSCNRICLYELLYDESDYFDWNGTSNVPTACAIETRSLGWKDNGNALKKLLCGDLYVDRLVGTNTVHFDFKWRSDEDPVWQDWHALDLCAPIADCSAQPWCVGYPQGREQYRTFVRLPNPPERCSASTGRYLHTFYEAQMRLAWTGFVQLNRFHAWTLPMVDSVVTACPTNERCTLNRGCDLPWFDYQIEAPCPP